MGETSATEPRDDKAAVDTWGEPRNAPPQVLRGVAFKGTACEVAAAAVEIEEEDEDGEANGKLVEDGRRVERAGSNA